MMLMLEKLMSYSNYILSKPSLKGERFKCSFREMVGLLPASEGTPDIYYCADKLSQQVAIRSFLTMWFLDDPIRQLVKQRSESVICGLSPLAGGRRLEAIFNDRAQLNPITERRTVPFLGKNDMNYLGRCYTPEFNGHGAIVKKGFMAVYSTCAAVDAENSYTWKAQ